MLGTWRTNDAEKNHTHKIRKKEKKEGKRKRNPTMDGIGLENGMGFLCGKGKHTKEGRNYDTIRGGRRRSRSGTSEHNQPYLTLPYLTFYTCIVYRLSAGYVPVVVRDYMLHTS